MKTIIVPTDFSSCAQNALKYAIQFARQTGSRLRLLHVLWPDRIHKTEATHLSLHKMNELYAKLTAELGYQNHPVPVSLKVAEGYSTPEQILIEANAAHAVLIIMGTHGESFLQQAFFGNNAVNTIFKADVPVLLIPVRCRYHPVTKLVCGSDMDGLSIELDFVAKLARWLVADLEVLHLGYGWDRQDRKNEFDKNVKKAYPYVQFNYKKISIDLPLIINLSHYMKNASGEILVMFPRERTFLDKLLVSSKTEKLCYLPGKPILAIRKQLLDGLENKGSEPDSLTASQLNNYLFNPSSRTKKISS